MPVNIHGKQYRTVSERVELFRKEHPDWTIQNELVSNTDTHVVFKTEIYNDKGRLIASGHAEEKRNASKILSTSALEVAETSATGRALAFFGLGGDEIASADEVAAAIAQENAPEAPPRAQKAKTDAGILDGFLAALRDAQNLATLKEIWQEGSGLLDGDSLKKAMAVKDAMKEKLK